MRLEAAVFGDLRKDMKQEIQFAEQAITQGVVNTGLDLKDAYQRQVRESGLGEKMAKTWQMKRYPPSGVSLGTAVLVYNKFSRVISAFNDGVLIRSSKGAFLAIPTENAPKRGMGGKRISPSTFPEHSLGKLRFIYRRGAPSLLIVDGLRASTGKRGGFRKASAGALKSGRGLITVVMFILVPQAHLRKRLDIDGPEKQAFDRLPNNILQVWPEAKDAQR